MSMKPLPGSEASDCRRRPGCRGVVAVPLAGLVALMVTACATPAPFVESTGQFAEATAALVGASELYLAEADRAPFDVSLARAEFTGQPITKAVLDRPLFPPDDMTARRTLLEAMRAYAAALVRIATGQLGAEFRGAVGELRGALLTFQQHLQLVSESSRLQALQRNTGFVSDVFGAIGGMIVEQVQADAIAEAIVRADEPMREAADLLAQDMALVTDRIRAARALEFASAVDGINPLLPGVPLEQRMNLIAALRPYRDRVLDSRAAGTEFEAALTSYRAAQTGITAFARARRDPRSLPDAIAAVDLFAIRARALLTMVRRGPVAALPTLQEKLP